MHIQIVFHLKIVGCLISFFFFRGMRGNWLDPFYTVLLRWSKTLNYLKHSIGSLVKELRGTRDLVGFLMSSTLFRGRWFTNVPTNLHCSFKNVCENCESEVLLIC